jgi:hypothetical protein
MVYGKNERGAIPQGNCHDLGVATTKGIENVNGCMTVGDLILDINLSLKNGEMKVIDYND